MERDTLAEVGNISMGSAATAPANITGKRVSITSPEVEIVPVDEIIESYPIPCLVAEIRYLSGLMGTNLLILKERDAAVIAAMMLGESPEDREGAVGAMVLSAVGEAMNQMIGYTATSMSHMFSREVHISPPSLVRCDSVGDSESLNVMKEATDVMVQISFRLEVGQVIDSILIQLIPLAFAREITGFLLEGDRKEAADDQENTGEPSKPAEIETPDKSGEFPHEVAGQSPDNGIKGNLALSRGMAMENTEMTGRTPWHRFHNLEAVRDIPVEITAIFGTTKVTLGRLLAMGKGGILELKQFANEPCDIMVNGKAVARGEVVAVNGYLGVRIISFEPLSASPGEKTG